MNTAASYQMQIEWNEQTKEWFQRASAYTGFHEKLSEILLARIPGAETVCDLGCGAGMIDFYMYDKVKQITCVDRVPEAIRLLNERIAAENIQNMEACCEDIRLLQGEWDACMMLFVGIVPEDIGTYLKYCRDKLLIVYRGGCPDLPICKGHDRSRQKSLFLLYNRLLAAGVRCSMTEYALEYGQPFTDLTDAFRYVAFYNKNPDNYGVMDYIHSTMHKTYQLPYPYYLPYKKRFGLIEIKREENEHLLKKPV